MSKFSIIIPVYNVAPYLRECLDSVLKQTFTDWEAICVDDGSTDGSGAILDEYAAKDKRFRVIHQANAGVSAARNRALEEIKGEWVGFLDADDVWSPFLLEKCFKQIKLFPVIDVVAFGFEQFEKISDLQFINDSCHNGVFFDARDRLDDKNIVSSFWGKVYRVNLVKEKRFKHYIVGEDLLFLLDVMLEASYTITIKDRLYGYRIRNNSVMQSGVSTTKVIDSVLYSYDRLLLLSNSLKFYSKWFGRLLLNSLMENPFLLMDSLQKENYDLVYKKWSELVQKIPMDICMSWFQRVRLKIFRIIPLKSVSFFIFKIPLKLKKYGMRRS